LLIPFDTVGYSKSSISLPRPFRDVAPFRLSLPPSLSPLSFPKPSPFLPTLTDISLSSTSHQHTQSSERFLNWSSTSHSKAASTTGSSSSPYPSNPPSRFNSPPIDPSPLPPPFQPSQSQCVHPDVEAEPHSFLVRSFIPEGEEPKGDIEAKVDGEGVRYKEEMLEGLVTPPVDKGGKRIRYCVLEVRPSSAVLLPCLSPARPGAHCAFSFGNSSLLFCVWLVGSIPP
jgi:hypothetical protein